MGFLTILWWGRIGKVMAFLGGLTLILDLIGPERLRRLGRNHGIIATAFVLLVFTISIVPCGILYTLLTYESAVAVFRDGYTVRGALWRVAVNVVVVQGLASLILRALFPLAASLADHASGALDKPTPVLGLRITAAVVIVAGFHLDLLAS